MVCEYLSEGDTREDAVARAHELLGGQVGVDISIRLQVLHAAPDYCRCMHARWDG